MENPAVLPRDKRAPRRAVFLEASILNPLSGFYPKEPLQWADLRKTGSGQGEMAESISERRGHCTSAVLPVDITTVLLSKREILGSTVVVSWGLCSCQDVNQNGILKFSLCKEGKTMLLFQTIWLNFSIRFCQDWREFHGSSARIVNYLSQTPTAVTVPCFSYLGVMLWKDHTSPVC